MKSITFIWEFNAVKIYLVGGAVRNKLLNLPITDRDWVVVGATPEVFLNKSFKQVGKNFPVFLHPDTNEEYALARKEKKYGMGHSDFNISYSPNVTLKEDLIRRDLTINSIAQDKFGKFIDPFQGRQDIKKGLLRHVSSAFSEDPLRILRVARFAASLFHLGFDVAFSTMMLMKNMVKNKDLCYLKSDRIWKETEKALKTPNPHVYFKVLHSCNALLFLFPELYILNNIFPLIDNIESINQYSLMALARISSITQDIEIRFAFLCQFIGKISHCFILGHKKKDFDTYTVVLIKNLCKRLRIPNSIKDLSVIFTVYLEHLYTIEYRSSSDIIRLLGYIDAWRKPNRINKLALLSDAYVGFVGNFLKHNFNQPGEYLIQAFLIAQEISPVLVVQKGYKGIEIHHELYRLRVLHLEKWRYHNMKKNSNEIY